jgi:hypothetical protein
MIPKPGDRGAGSRLGRSTAKQGAANMTRERNEISPDDMAIPDLPSDSGEIAEEGEKNRKAMDDIPAHGTDPLHEGP